MDGIRYWIETEGTGHWFFVAFPVTLLCLFIWFKGRRARFLIPSLIISLVIINPLFYKFWDELGFYAYWRILWIIPVIPVLSGLVPSITERIQKNWIKAIVTVTGVCLIIFGGTFLYNGTGGTFVEAANAAKLPDYVVQIADRLLELDDHPRVITQDPIGVYIRQYSAQIDTLYGRDIEGYILTDTSIEAGKVHSEVSNFDSSLDHVNQMMLDGGYEFLVTNREIGEGFNRVDRVADYGIYRAIGIPTVKKKRNDLGQIVSVTTLDNNGYPINGETGFATINYSYDDHNRKVYEFHTDVEGKGIADQFGCAGNKWEYDDKDNIIRLIKLGSDGNPAEGILGFAEVRRTFSGGRIISESYFDAEGKPTNQVNGFASFVTTYDKQGDFCERTYYDLYGKPINCNDGYSKVSWEYDENKKTRSAVFFDAEGKRVKSDRISLILDKEYDPDGWTVWMTPRPNANNYCIQIGILNLGNKNVGDSYTCRVTVEFENVSAIEGEEFRIKAQGAQDGAFKTDNIWSPNLINLKEPLENGIYTFSSTTVVSEEMMTISTFNIEFRCDYWETGSFRIRDIVIERV